MLGRQTLASTALRTDSNPACRHLWVARPAPSPPGSLPAAPCLLGGPGRWGGPVGPWEYLAVSLRGGHLSSQGGGCHILSPGLLELSLRSSRPDQAGNSSLSSSPGFRVPHPHRLLLCTCSLHEVLVESPFMTVTALPPMETRLGLAHLPSAMILGTGPSLSAPTPPQVRKPAAQEDEKVLEMVAQRCEYT